MTLNFLHEPGVGFCPINGSCNGMRQCSDDGSCNMKLCNYTGLCSEIGLCNNDTERPCRQLNWLMRYYPGKRLNDKKASFDNPGSNSIDITRFS